MDIFNSRVSIDSRTNADILTSLQCPLLSNRLPLTNPTAIPSKGHEEGENNCRKNWNFTVNTYFMQLPVIRNTFRHFTKWHIPHSFQWQRTLKYHRNVSFGLFVFKALWNREMYFLLIETVYCPLGWILMQCRQNQDNSDSAVHKNTVSNEDVSDKWESKAGLTEIRIKQQHLNMYFVTLSWADRLHIHQQSGSSLLSETLIIMTSII